MEELHVIFKGQVQGVGFRATTMRLAHKHRVYGWVKNKSDGTVELLAQGEKEVLFGFLADIKDYFSFYLTDSAENWRSMSASYHDFRIIY
ncbi:MAG: acylphosphatase [Candidatus Margulisbacteria bacterium]|nr:acylphosphatase [Candidatus Margulisiibacteriota bacterium]